MKKWLTYFILAAGLCSCKESLPPHFDQIEGVYFNNTGTGRVPVDKKTITFVYENEDVDSILVPVSVQLLGRPGIKDRTISLEAFSDNSAEGDDWIVARSAVLPAGETSATVPVTLRRTQGLKSEEKSLVLRLLGNSEFILPFESRKNAAGELISATEFTIFFSEMFTAAPLGWKTIFMGSFSQPKFELVCKVTGTERILFNTPGAISDAKWMFMRSKVTEYIIEQDNLRKNGQDYDPAIYGEDGNLIDLNK